MSTSNSEFVARIEGSSDNPAYRYPNIPRKEPFRVAEEPMGFSATGSAGTNNAFDDSCDTPYARMSDLVGIGVGGPPDIARDHKRIYREALSKRGR